ncbi:hypothetical protein OF83DRAFT_1057563 [Amylostereum chailletii]|nr:hypothetical protein OF83DRAFT_1057563 [Amylostereum chailletii]
MPTPGLLSRAIEVILLFVKLWIALLHLKTPEHAQALRGPQGLPDIPRHLDRRCLLEQRT